MCCEAFLWGLLSFWWFDEFKVGCCLELGRWAVIRRLKRRSVLTRRRIGARVLLAFSGLVQRFLFVCFSGMGLGG